MSNATIQDERYLLEAKNQINLSTLKNHYIGEGVPVTNIRDNIDKEKVYVYKPSLEENKMKRNRMILKNKLDQGNKAVKSLTRNPQ